MKRIIIIRVCEIFLKGKNRFYFLNLLEEHVKKALTGINFKLEKLQMRYLVEDFDESDFQTIIDKLKKVSGVHTISPAYSVDSDYEKIKECVLPLCQDFKGSFKVETNRADKSFPIPSVELSRMIGGDVLSVYGKDVYVDVKKPENIVKIDMRENGKSLIYTQVIKCVGGMPIGSSGHGFLMLSGGIDSPVAGYMMCKRGMKLSSVHFHSYPYTGEAAKEKVITLGKMIAEYSAGMKLYVVKFTKIQEAIHERCAEDLMITMMRRFMMRITERLAKMHGGQAIITGESLGQVASQTVESITSSNSVVEMPVFRPLIAFDKLETIEIAEKIGTYETSILPYEDCCTVFLPKYPAIKPKMDRILKEEARLDVESLIEEAINDVEVIQL
ncbi:MAG: tRNA 4-thiouridine(8) synthase ThiI [Clostridia bacterium]|nr:tRNA 4-thiouridine(8) synthase ThiI [Clostridia bacterium]